jgi:hypothetical protein
MKTAIVLAISAYVAAISAYAYQDAAAACGKFNAAYAADGIRAAYAAADEHGPGMALSCHYVAIRAR